MGLLNALEPEDCPIHASVTVADSEAMGNCHAALILWAESILAYKPAYNSGSARFRLLPRRRRSPWGDAR
jgi:hypothetical protein